MPTFSRLQYMCIYVPLLVAALGRRVSLLVSFNWPALMGVEAGTNRCCCCVVLCRCSPLLALHKLSTLPGAYPACATLSSQPMTRLTLLTPVSPRVTPLGPLVTVSVLHGKPRACGSCG